MSSTAQRRALQQHRSRLSEPSLARFEVLGLDADRDLIRSLAKQLGEGDHEAARMRAASPTARKTSRASIC